MDAWQRCLERLEAEYPVGDVQAYVASLQPLMRDDRFVLLAPNAYALEQVRTEFLPRIKELMKHFGDIDDVHLEVGSLPSSRPIIPQSVTQGPTPAPLPSAPSSLFDGPVGVDPDPQSTSNFHGFLDSEFTFDNFVEGRSNMLARAAALEAANNPGKRSNNPLLLFGGTGVGKTHLMFAAGNEIKRLNPRARVLYLSSQQYLNAFLRAVRNKQQDEFKQQFRHIDCLLVDDVQFLARGEATQDEFFFTFNTLFDGQKQLILTCDRYPKEVEGLHSRLKSRLAMGHAVAVDPPDFETRASIVIRKAEDRGKLVPDDVAMLLAKRVQSNVRELEGALNTLIANANFTGQPITVEFAQVTLKHLFHSQRQSLSIPNIIKVVADYYGLQIKDLLGPGRRATVVLPRHMAIALAKELTDESLPGIGDAFNGRDHTTVLHACRRIQERLRTDGKVSEDWEKLVRKLSE